LLFVRSIVSSAIDKFVIVGFYYIGPHMIRNKINSQYISGSKHHLTSQIYKFIF